MSFRGKVESGGGGGGGGGKMAHMVFIREHPPGGVPPKLLTFRFCRFEYFDSDNLVFSGS